MWPLCFTDKVLYTTHVYVSQRDFRFAISVAYWVLDANNSEMVLIDLDSLVRIEEKPKIDYIRSKGLNSFDYIWWQCFAAAMVWKLKISQFAGCKQLQDLANGLDGWGDERRTIT